MFSFDDKEAFSVEVHTYDSLFLYQIAEAAYFTLKHLTSELADIHSPELSYYSCLEEAELCWAQGEKSLALMLISKLVDCLQNVRAVV